jgi:hypothetical protein
MLTEKLITGKLRRLAALHWALDRHLITPFATETKAPCLDDRLAAKAIHWLNAKHPCILPNVEPTTKVMT